MESKTWKDTAMSLEERLKFEPVQDGYSYAQAYGKAITEAQAEISFKAGQENVLLESKKGTLTVSSLVNRGRQEVVEFIRHRDKNYSHTNWGDVLFRQDILAQLKEWGI